MSPCVSSIKGSLSTRDFFNFFFNVVAFTVHVLDPDHVSVVYIIYHMQTVAVTGFTGYTLIHYALLPTPTC